jgi:hypothetical protein
MNLLKRSALNTSICLLGCSIGDFGVLIYFATQYAEPVSPMIQMAFAIPAGITTSIILETIILVVREHFPLKKALSVAFGMSLISMVMMEVAMNVTDLAITMPLGIKPPSLLYFLVFIPALIAGFLAAWPYNYWRLKKHGKGCCGA